MQRINERTIVLTDDENKTVDHFYDLLDEGKSIVGASWVALRFHDRERSEKASDAFIDYLSDDTCYREPSSGKVNMRRTRETV
jgi:hypothetical protein